MYHRSLYLATAQLYPVLPHSHIGRHITGQAPCGSIFGPARKRNVIPTASPSSHYTPAGTGHIGNYDSMGKLGSKIKLVPHAVKVTTDTDQPSQGYTYPCR